MKPILLRVILVACFAGCAHDAASQVAQAQSATFNQPLRTLFIGNSYTYYNDMPSMVAAFAASASQPLPVKDLSRGAASLESLWGLPSTLRTIRNEQWEIVVLQEQSERPIVSPRLMSQYVRLFDSAIKKVGAQTILFVTWSRRAQPKTQQTINAAYSKSAAELGAVIAPVGPAWQIALDLDPTLSLYDADGHHPTRTGSYIAACTLYMVIAKSDKPCPPLAVPGISDEDGVNARAAALQAVSASRQLAPQHSTLP